MNPTFWEMMADVTSCQLAEPVTSAALHEFYGTDRAEARRLLCRWHARGWLWRRGIGQYEVKPDARLTRAPWSKGELEQLAILRQAALTYREIAARLGRSPQGVSLAYRRYVRGTA